MKTKNCSYLRYIENGQIFEFIKNNNAKLARSTCRTNCTCLGLLFFNLFLSFLDIYRSESTNTCWFWALNNTKLKKSTFPFVSKLGECRRLLVWHVFGSHLVRRTGIILIEYFHKGFIWFSWTTSVAVLPALIIQSPQRPLLCQNKTSGNATDHAWVHITTALERQTHLRDRWRREIAEGKRQTYFEKKIRKSRTKSLWHRSPGEC